MNERTWRESKQRKTNQEINREKKYIWKDTQTLRTNFCSAMGRGMVAIIRKLIDEMYKKEKLSECYFENFLFNI